jgi:hypothetical protein
VSSLLHKAGSTVRVSVIHRPMPAPAPAPAIV